MTVDADRIIGLYDRNASAWDEVRSRVLIEGPWLRRFAALLPPAGSVLDIGCGSGEPIAGFFVRAGHQVHGVDSSPAMIALCKKRFADSSWTIADMRTLSLGTAFNGLLAWDSFFHLTREDQRGMFAIFRAHAAPGAVLMFTSGDSDGVAMGTFGGEPLYHASLAPDDYRALLTEHGFVVEANVFNDAQTGGHSIWLARRSL